MPKSVSLSYYVARRAVSAVPLILGVILVTFFLIRLAPGDPAVMAAGERATKETLELVRHKYGLDQPLYIQLFLYVSALLHGDLGYSYAQGTSVLNLIMPRIPNTFLLVGSALALGYGIGIALGTQAALRPFSLRDNILSFIGLAAYSIPWFWLALMLILAFAVFIPIFPTGGMETAGSPGYPLDIAYHMVLPVVALSAYYLGTMFRLTRSSMIETLGMDFITFARAKGISEEKTIYSHALRNAILSPFPVMGVHVAQAFGGATIIESVFAWPGMGRLIFTSMLQRDYPVMMGTLVIMAFFAIAVSLAVDILYAVLDPRIMYT